MTFLIYLIAAALKIAIGIALRKDFVLTKISVSNQPNKNINNQKENECCGLWFIEETGNGFIF